MILFFGNKKIMAIDNENATVDFFCLTTEEKENFIKNMILIQISVAKFTNGFFQDIRNIFHNHLVLMNALLESNFVKLSSDKLIRTMTA